MASLTQCTWVWASSRSWWWIGKPGMLQSTGLQRVGYDWATKLNWIISIPFIVFALAKDTSYFLIGHRISPFVASLHSLIPEALPLLSPRGTQSRFSLWLLSPLCLHISPAQSPSLFSYLLALPWAISFITNHVSSEDSLIPKFSPVLFTKFQTGIYNSLANITWLSHRTHVQFVQS